MSHLPTDDENDANTEQFTALLLRYLHRRASQAQNRTNRRNRNNNSQREGIESPTSPNEDDDDEEDEEDESHSPDTENEDSAWSRFFRSNRKKKSVPKLDLIDIDEIENEEEEHQRDLGRLMQWIDDNQINDIKLYDKSGDNEEKEEKKDDQKHEPLICDYNSHFIPYNFTHFLEQREIGKCTMWNHSSYRGAIGRCSDYLFSNDVIEKFQGNSRVFCSDFSNDGNVLCAASQDHVIHLIDSRTGVNSSKWPIKKQVESQFSGWSIIDVALSPDHEFVAYSGWSSSIYLVNAYGSHELHEAHDLNISTFNSWGRCCVFGIEFDPNSKKVICALSGGCLILHDLERKVNEFSDPSAHDDDINQATFLDSNTIISGSDDALLRVWDTRQKNKCVGGFVGHYQGITCVSTPNDYGSSKYILSNSKDQTMKLWDLRKMNTLSQLISTRAQLQPSTGSFDYRYRGWNPKTSSTHKKKFRIDTSLVSYRGHSVSRTLCRSGFSPIHSTSAKYVYCGSSDCEIYIYETLTAKVHRRLRAHTDIVRDVCWHPFLPIIVSASWDGSVVRWSYKGSNKDGIWMDTQSKDNQDIQDKESSEMPKPVTLDMPEHLRKRNDYDYW